MGPLEGLRFIEIGGIGPGPFCGMMLADMGADVIAVHRKGHLSFPPLNVTERGKRSICLDLKDPSDIARVLKLCENADGLFEGFRPGVMERLGVGPDVCMQQNPRLAYGRISGWGQDGPMAMKAGHDINYMALSGILDLNRGRDGHPALPGNIIADYGGGALYMAFGMLCAVLSAKKTGHGQVVDLALSEGAASLASIYFSGARSDFLRTMLTGSAPHYNVYRCADGNHMSVGALEPQFYSAFLTVLGLSEDSQFADQMEQSLWSFRIQKLAAIFETLTRDEWVKRFEQVDCCVIPVNSLSEVATHPQMVARNNFMTVNESISPAPTPRFSRTPSSVPKRPREVGADTEAVFKEFNL